MRIAVLLHSFADHFRQPLSAEYRPAFKVALVQQLIVGLLSALMLDGGLRAHIWEVAMLAYWLSVALIVCRRPTTLTPGDLWFVRFGFLVTEAATYFVGQAIWQQMGRI